MGSNKNNVFWHVEWSVRIPYCYGRRPNTKIQLLCLCISALFHALQRVCMCACALCLMGSENGLWHVEGQRTQHWIILVAAHIRFSCFLLVVWHGTFSYLLSPSSHTLVSFSHSIDLIWTADVEERDKGGERGGEEEGRGLLVFFESECGIIICFLEGVVVQKQPAGEPCLLYLIGTESMTPWLKTQLKHFHTHKHTIHICSDNSLFSLYHSHTSDQSILLWR